MNSTVLVVEDDTGLREALCDTLELSGIATLRAPDGAAALDLLSREDIRVVVSDVQMARVDGLRLLRKIKSTQPGLPVLIMTAFGTIQEAVDAMRDGAADYLVKPFEAEVLVSKVTGLLGATVSSVTATGMVARDSQSEQLVALAKRVAQSDVTVLISGESGTGKEVLARLIHGNSRRSEESFVAINCAAIPGNMLEALLFGYEKGAYTGAYKAAPGKFEQAQGGTLLLDEVSEMDLLLQAKLPRVLQEREVERLGSRSPIPLDVRVIATSNRDMRGEVAAGRFREDLFYRLNVFPLNVPPLRERRDDIVPIAEHLSSAAAREQGVRRQPEFSAQAKARLQAYDWPGNVRELDNLVKRTLVLQEGPVIDAADLQFEVVATGELRRPSGSPPVGQGGENLGDDLRAAEQRLILDALKADGGSRKLAAEKLGISPRTLRYKLAQMRAQGIEIPKFLG